MRLFRRIDQGDSQTVHAQTVVAIRGHSVLWSCNAPIRLGLAGSLFTLVIFWRNRWPSVAIAQISVTANMKEYPTLQQDEGFAICQVDVLGWDGNDSRHCCPESTFYVSGRSRGRW